MRVLHVYKSYPPVLGGIEGHVALLAHEQSRRGIEAEVLVCAKGPSATTMEDGVRVHRAREWLSLRSMPLSLDFLRRLARARVDVLHLHTPFPLGELGAALFARDQATVMTYHSDIVRQRILGALYRPLQRLMLRRIDRVLATSPPYVSSSPVLSRIDRDRIEVVPLGIRLEDFSRTSAEDAARYRAELGDQLILFVGRLRNYKGLDVLLRAMADESLEQEKPEGRVSQAGKARLAIIGRGAYEQQVLDLTRSLGISDRVSLVGDVSRAELAAYLSAARLLVLPSTRRSEAFGLVLAEAMAASTPVISTELGTGTSWVNQHGETGLVVPPNDSTALARAIAKLLDNETLRETMARRARARASECFDHHDMVDHTIRVYRDVLAQRGN